MLSEAGPGAAAPMPSHRVLEQAAHWYACLRDGQAGESQRKAWQRWLAAAEEHGTAWRYVQEISQGFEPVRSLPDGRAAAEHLGAAAGRLRVRRRVLAGIGVLSATGLAGWMGWRQAGWPDEVVAWGADHGTRVGQQRQVDLPDGSRLWLNTASAVNLDFSAQQRRIAWVAGEVFIETAQDAARPFLVDTVQGRLRALGTRFNVRGEGATVRLAVFDGAVEIRTAAGEAVAVVPAGRQAAFSADRIGPLEPADMAREAWTQGALVADDMALDEVVRELRRYRRGHLGVDDAVAGLRVYGSFPLHDTDRVLRMLASALPLRIAQPMPWWTTIEAAR